MHRNACGFFCYCNRPYSSQCPVCVYSPGACPSSAMVMTTYGQAGFYWECYSKQGWQFRLLLCRNLAVFQWCLQNNAATRRSDDVWSNAAASLQSCLQKAAVHFCVRQNFRCVGAASAARTQRTSTCRILGTAAHQTVLAPLGHKTDTEV